ncbi:hypothetical protein BXU06_15115 [Aquaspirillum sp. LM1]|nr:hypothetical protein BXU06_15115 [Aquaspirillum sp. LM1]
MPTPLPEQTPEQAGEHPQNAPVSDLHRRYPDLLGARVAMQRAAEAARRLAEQMGTELVVGEPMREGRPGAGTTMDVYRVINS